ncbi:hypothetical protein Tco_1050568 [Tanacetum coccineum]
MLARPIYQGDRVTELHHVHNIWKAKHPWDILLESRNAEMFSLTYKLTHYLMCYPTSFSPYVFKFMETCEVLTLMELYDVMCKAEYDLPINSHDKTNKRKADDKESDNQVTKRTEGFFNEPVAKKRTAFSKCYIAKILGIRLGNVLSIFVTRRSLNEKEISTKKACLAAVLIVVQHQVLKKMCLKLH